jgi:hypothetical protein
VQIDPLLSKGGISQDVATPALTAQLTMNNIQIHGISSIYLSEVYKISSIYLLEVNRISSIFLSEVTA